MSSFSNFLGFDPTGGAVSQGQRAKPLKACLIKKKKSKWEVFTHEGLPIRKDLKTKSFFPIWYFLNRARDFGYQNVKYDREVAEKFFSGFFERLD